MRILLLLAIAILTVGCATNNQQWKAVEKTDPFNDSAPLLVTTGHYASGDSVVTRHMKLYLVVRKDEDKLSVGVMSGGRFPVPVGAVQIRVDDHNTWNISPSETPDYAIPDSNYWAGTSGYPQSDEVSKTQAQMMENVSRATSPFTLAGGEKAAEIIKQMAGGKKVIYRATMIGQPSSTIGEASIDQSFIDSLSKIGINPSNL